MSSDKDNKTEHTGGFPSHQCTASEKDYKPIERPSDKSLSEPPNNKMVSGPEENKGVVKK